MATATEKAESWIRSILSQGQDPKNYRRGVARECGLDVEAVDDIIASVGGAPRVVSAETVAQERLTAERAAAKADPAAYRASQHEED